MKCFFSKTLLFLLFSSIVHTVFAAEGDTTIVRVHDAVDMTWYGNYDEVAVFPDHTGKTYRKVLMHYTMGCATGGCSDWDYTTQIWLMNPTGIMDSTVASLDTVSTNPLIVDTTWNTFEVMNRMELGRVITPYGANLNNSWTREFIFDVTDFVEMLQDSTQIRAHYSGWSSGFSVTLDFEFIEGTPPHDVIGVYPLYEGSSGYNNSADFEANFFTAKDVDIPANTQHARVYSTITGHGFDNNINCAEFCIRDYTIKVDGNTASTRTIWNDGCGSNPLYPQAGTWLYDRAGWCPGDKGDIHEIDVTSSVTNGTTNSIDFDMQNYTWTGNQAPSYTVDARLVAYGAPNFANDASIEAIMAPNNDFEYNRMNPICGEPMVKIKNTGGNPLTSVVFRYGLAGAEDCVYEWTGNVAFLDYAEITLPTLNWENADLNNPMFSVQIASVNGVDDEYDQNDMLSASFNMPDVYTYDSIYVELKTNMAGNETGYQIRDADGNIVHERVATSLASNTTYNDVVYLSEGCYTLSVQDASEDGLSFWANSSGSGSIKFLRYVPSLSTTLPFKTFGADFGTGLEYAFVIGSDASSIDAATTTGCTKVHTETLARSVFNYSLYPNPNTGNFAVDVALERNQEVGIQVFDAMGRVVYQSFGMMMSGQNTLNIDIPNAQNGIYFLYLNTEEGQSTEKFVIQH